MPVRTTHVGSLPRSAAGSRLPLRPRARRELRPRGLRRLHDGRRRPVVRRQVEAGIDIVSDGETSKISYATYVKDRYSGFAGDSPRNAPADLKLFPTFLERLAKSGGTPTYARPMCVDESAPKGQGELERTSPTSAPPWPPTAPRQGFMNAASPGVISLFLQNDFYPSREAYLAALADVMRRRIPHASLPPGLDLQLDCPDLALSRHMLFTDLSDAEFVQASPQTHVEALNHALARTPAGPHPRPHLLGQLRRPARLRHRHGQGLRASDECQRALHPVRDLQPAPRPRMDRVPRPRCRNPRRQGPGPGRRRHHHELRRAPRPRRAASGTLHRNRRRGSGDRRFGLRLWHLCGLRRRRPRDRLGQTRHAEGGRPARRDDPARPHPRHDVRLRGCSRRSLPRSRPPSGAAPAPTDRARHHGGARRRGACRRAAALCPCRPVDGRHRRDGGAAPGARPGRTPGAARHQPAGRGAGGAGACASPRSRRRCRAISRR